MYQQRYHLLGWTECRAGAWWGEGKGSQHRQLLLRVEPLLPCQALVAAAQLWDMCLGFALCPGIALQPSGTGSED